MTSNDISIDTPRLMRNLKELGDAGRGKDNRLVRLAASDADKEGRDLLIEWMKELDMVIDIDQVGNIFGTWQTDENQDKAPVMTGSHIDSVTDAGIYDGCYGVLSGLEVVRELKSNNVKTERPVTVAAFTNEEGVRYPPSMMAPLYMPAEGQWMTHIISKVWMARFLATNLNV